MKTIRKLCLLLSVCLIMSVFASCGEDSGITTEVDTTDKVETSETKITESETRETEPESTDISSEPEETNSETTATESETAATEPETTATEPETTATEPETTATEPETTATESETTVTEPESTEPEPEVTTTEPETTTAETETTVETEIEYYEGFEFTSNGDGTCYISGIGAFTDKSIIIPSTSPTNDVVIGISEKVFYGCEGLTDVVIPEGVTSIGEYAFAYCEDLRSISIPNSIEQIGYNAFVGSNLVFYEELGRLYLGNESNKYVVLVDTVDKMTSYVNINNNTKVILYNAFSGCDRLEQLNIPEGVVSIGRAAFSNCSKLKTVTLPATLKQISNEAFSDCPSMTRINYRGLIAAWEDVTLEGDVYNIFFSVTLVLGYGTGDEFWIEHVPMEEQ